MAISLNNHESRIKVLEGKIISPKCDIKLCHSGYNVSVDVTIPSITKYPNAFITVICDNGGRHTSSGTRYSEKTMNVSVLKSMLNYYFGITDPAANGDEVEFSCISDTVIRVRQSAGNDVPYKVYWTNLTIYYIVRYNIYKLVRFLSHLNTKFGGERR